MPVSRSPRFAAGPRGFARAALSVALIGSIASPALFAAAPSAAPASIEGTVVRTGSAPGTDAPFRPVSGAIVRAADVSSGEVHDSAATTDAGGFRIEGLPAGSYSVAVQTADGIFVTADVVTLAAGQPGRVSFSLRERADSTEAGGGAGAAPAEHRKYDCSTRKDDKNLTDAQRREKREFCGWWATTSGWAKFGIIAGSAIAFGATAAAIANDGDNDEDKEKNPSPSSPSRSQAP